MTTDAVLKELDRVRQGATGRRKLNPVPVEGLWFTEADRLDDGTWRCSFCGCYMDRGGVVDHCHATGLRRGLLCHSCNSHEGFHDTPALNEWRLTAPDLTIGQRSVHGREGWYAGFTTDELMTAPMADLLDEAKRRDIARQLAESARTVGVITAALAAGAADLAAMVAAR